MMIIGVDYHPSFQAIAFCVEETGECGEQELSHSDGQAEKFYRELKQRGASVRVGREATGYARWFERLLAELGFELWIGDPAEIEAKRIKKQKTDRNDAGLLRRLMLENNFPQIWIPSPENRDLRQLLWHRHRLVQMRTRIMNQLQALAMNEGYRWKKKLFSEQGRALLEKLALAPWASRRRQELLELLDRLNPTIEELTAAVEREARKRPEVLRLMSHPGVGPLTALAYVLIIGTPARFQRGKRLADVCDQYRREKDVEPLAADFLAPFNAGKIRPESWITVSEFAEKHWLPWAELNCKPSTVAGYKTLWNTYLAPFVPSKALREFRTVDAANLFAEIHRAKKIGRTTLQHCKSPLNGNFTLARNLGALDSANPVIGAMIPKKAAAPAETYAATPDEVLTILELLRKDGEVKARAAVALMFFAGLRPGGARGACWQDFDGKRLCIRQSVWHKFTTAPKTENAASPVPVIPMLAEILTELRRADGNPADGPILRGPSKKPLLLDNLSKRIVIPALRRCATCGEQESGHKTEHDFKLDESLPTWHGWYSLRRGVATTLAGLTRDGMASKGLLRHTNLATTTRHYVKDVPENTQSAMILLETLCNRSATDSDTRPN